MFQGIKHCHEIQLQNIPDRTDGFVIVAEFGHQIPFAIKRVYCITHSGNTQAIRGRHAHKKLEEAIFCVSGSFELELDDGRQRAMEVLRDPGSGIYLGPGLWRVMKNFSRGCVVLVIASDVYDGSDYVRDYDEFLRFIEMQERVLG